MSICILPRQLELPRRRASRHPRCTFLHCSAAHRCQAVNAYQRLSALLRGEYPAGLLPPAPQGYLAARIRQLGEGSCLAAYEWAGGGEWGGKPWSPELPTDSALAFYLVAAYLAAPQWLFPQVPAWGLWGLWGVWGLSLTRASFSMLIADVCPHAASASQGQRRAPAPSNPCIPLVPAPPAAHLMHARPPHPPAAPQDDSTAISGLSGTLYLGRLPSKPADSYFGVLSARPPPTPKVAAVARARQECGPACVGLHGL